MQFQHHGRHDAPAGLRQNGQGRAQKAEEKIEALKVGDGDMKIFEYCTCSARGICPFCIQLSMIVIAAVFGISLIIWPKKAIDLQILFYRILG